MTGSIKAIETRYAGCHFRSRLEARWAVALDHLRIPWQYEAQGYEVGCRVFASGSVDDTFAYLPDFYLPTLGVYAEVKGSLTDDEMRRLVDAAAYLSAPHGGCGEGTDLVVLGPIPYPVLNRPARLHMCKGDLQLTPWNLTSIPECPTHSGRPSVMVADDSRGLKPGWERGLARILLSGMRGLPPAVPRYAKALTVARSARFEHGEVPTQPARFE